MNAAKATKGSKADKQATTGTTAKLAGSVKDLQQKALRALTPAPTLRTQKDGRLLAVQMLRKLEALEGKGRDGEFIAIARCMDENGRDEIVFREGEQSTLISDAFAAAHAAAPEVRAGFMQIMTDHIATGILIGERNTYAYEKWEKAGLFDAAPIAGSAKQAAPTMSDVMQKCAADIREINRKAAIEASKGNAERWAERANRAKAALRGIEVQDLNWGAIFTGSKAALIKAGLVSAQFVPAKGKSKEYRLPLNHHDGYIAACYGPTWGKIPPAWDVSITEGDEKGTYEVRAPYDWVDEMNIRERTQRAFEEMDRPDVNMSLLRRLVAEIPPLPLSVAVPEQIEKAKKYPVAEKFPK